jgi:transposase
MQPQFRQPPVEFSAKEEDVIKCIRNAKLFVFLRKYRHQIFNEAFQQELATLYQDSKRGQPPIAPAQIALAIILQAYMGVSD